MRIARRKRRIERPTSIDAAGDEHINRKRRARDVKIPRQQVEPRERHVASADHHRQQKISHGRRNRRHQKKPDHDDAVQREQPIVFVGGQEPAGRTDQFQPHQADRNTADEKENCDRQRIKDGAQRRSANAAAALKHNVDPKLL